jgi:hypothetical protein
MNIMIADVHKRVQELVDTMVHTEKVFAVTLPEEAEEGAAEAAEAAKAEELILALLVVVDLVVDVLILRAL